jgi:hypothetical protein
MEQRYVRSELLYRRLGRSQPTFGAQDRQTQVLHILGDVQYHTSLATELSAQTVAKAPMFPWLGTPETPTLNRQTFYRFEPMLLHQIQRERNSA